MERMDVGRYEKKKRQEECVRLTPFIRLEPNT